MVHLEKHNVIFALIPEKDANLTKKFDKLIEKILYTTLGIPYQRDIDAMAKKANIEVLDHLRQGPGKWMTNYMADQKSSHHLSDLQDLANVIRHL